MKVYPDSQCWKISQKRLILAFSTNFCPIEFDLFGNTVFQKCCEMRPFTVIFKYCGIVLHIDLMDDLEFFKSRGIGLINASPLALGLLTNQVDPPDWHIAPDLVKQCVKKAAKLCQDRGEDLGNTCSKGHLHIVKDNFFFSHDQ